MSKRKIIIGVVILLLIVSGFFISLNAKTTKDNVDLNNIFYGNVGGEATEKDYLIEIKGEIKNPGIYFVNSSYCVNDCIILAGGVTKNANLSQLNLAVKVVDGQTIVIPTLKNEEVLSDGYSGNEKISINTASEKELEALPGIGATLSKNIVNYRLEHGPFTKIEDILNVNKITENIFNKIKIYITV